MEEKAKQPLPEKTSPDAAFERYLNRRVLGKLLVIVVLMFSFGYALVPLYKKICELTGVNILTPRDQLTQQGAPLQVDRNRLITIEFDANNYGPLQLRPHVNSLQVHPGAIARVTYDVTNPQPVTMQAQAIPSYAPQASAAHFKKLECFCFQQQTFAPHESRSMPVVFYIDPALPRNIQTITLSYTFFQVGGSINKNETKAGIKEKDSATAQKSL